jgi:uncharacterized protein (TIGR00288 family)
MNSRHTPSKTPARAHAALIHRGPQAIAPAAHVSAPIHAPNAALLIDFDNVTMGIRSELGKELQSLLSSDIIKGKVSVRRAYADWRRYPQYIVPLSEASIDLIFAPAYGSSKKNATDIRLAIDALELVFTRPEIGTFVLLSGDSDFSSMVIKLKEYGKYVIGIGIRESSSDLLVQNCDEYYSYNALAGLVKASDEVDAARKYDPWELVTEAVQRMKRNNDVMRSDRLKQVMQEIDSSFDEKNLGISKFSRFCQEASQRGLLTVTKLENGQLEVDLPSGSPAVAPAAQAESTSEPSENGDQPPVAIEDRGPRRGRRGRGGRGRDREREPREPRVSAPVPDEPSPAQIEMPDLAQPVAEAPPPSEPVRAPSNEPTIGNAGERLTRAEAFDLVRRAVAEIAPGDESVRASDVRRRARQLLGRDSESLSERMFVRILKDAHDEDIIDLRRRGDDFEVARAAEAASVAQQVAEREQAAIAASAPPPAPPSPRVGMGPRTVGARGRHGAPPPDLLSIGVVGMVPSAAPAIPVPAPAAATAAAVAEKPARGRGRGRGKAEAAVAPPVPAPEPVEVAKPKRGGAKKAPTKPRGKKAAAKTKDQ